MIYLNFTATQSASGQTPDLRVSSIGVSYTYGASGTQLRVSALAIETALWPSGTHLETPFFVTQRAQYPQTPPHLETPVYITQYIQLPPEPYMSNEIFPELVGLSYEVHMKPTFSTKVATHTSGKETRTSYWEDPVWEFDLIFDYLPNRTGRPSSDIGKLLGFFLARKGSFDNFLFKMQECSHEDLAPVIVGDGIATEADLMAVWSSAYTPIGQVVPESLVLTATIIGEDHDIATFPLNHATDVTILDVKQGNVQYQEVPVGTAPVGSQYNFDPATGVMNVGNAGGVHVDYTAELVVNTDYTVVMPRTIQFTSAPPIGMNVAGTYDHYFICRFKDDQADFDTFMDQLWELQAITLRSDL